MPKGVHCSLGLAVVCLFALRIHAQVMPQNPTTRDSVIVRVLTPCAGGYEPAVDISGDVITVTMDEPDGCLTMISTFDIALGTLPPGTYTIHVVFPNAPAFDVVSTFAVSTVAVPSLEASALAILMSALILVALAKLR